MKKIDELLALFKHYEFNVLEKKDDEAIIFFPKFKLKYLLKWDDYFIFQAIHIAESANIYDKKMLLKIRESIKKDLLELKGLYYLYIHPYIKTGKLNKNIINKYIKKTYKEINEL